MLHQLKNWKFYVVFGLDLLLFVLALVSAYLIRFEFRLTTGEIQQIFILLPFFIGIKAITFFSFCVYRGMFRYASLADMWNILKASVFSTLLIIFGMMILNRFQGFSRGVVILDGMLTFLYTGGLRLGIRYTYKELVAGKRTGFRLPLFVFSGKNPKKPVLLYGAGDTGEKILRELKDNPEIDYNVVGLLDDDPGKWKRTIHGIPVLGGLKELPAVKKKFNSQEVLIAVPSATGQQMRKIVKACHACEIRFKTMPGLAELIDGRVSIKALRDVNYEDLLRRKPVKLHSEKISGYLSEKVVLVTGAGGSIGSELCRQIIPYRPKELVLLDASEPALYSIQMELKH